MSMYVTLTETSCTICSMPFAVTQTFWNRGKERGGDIYCPAGHVMTFGVGSLKKAEQEAVRLRAQLDQARSHAQTLEHSRNAMKGQVTKLKKRIGKGVCPCCNRQFANVERHMNTQHPDFADQPVAE